MESKLLAAIRRYEMVQPGDRVICAVSGGADSMALLWCMWLQKERLGITVEAAHFNHHLRAGESDRDEEFVRRFCDCHDIPLHVGSAQVKAGKKGLEAAARDARYAYLKSLDGVIATAHTADDNAETVLMHLIRGTGLRGLGGITPKQPGLIRPMLDVTREEVEDFLRENWIGHIEDSSNQTDAFLRNRIRHHVMPLLKAENPKLAENVSSMALRLRQDEACLSRQAAFGALPAVEDLKNMESAIRSRCLERFLKECGVREPEQTHIAAAEALVFSKNPSARAAFPGGVTIGRVYDRLEKLETREEPVPVVLPCPGAAEFGAYRVICTPAEEVIQTETAFTVHPAGEILLRCRQSGDSIRLQGGSKLLKKLFIDRKIPASLRSRIPVVCDEQGILGVYSIGVHRERAAETLPAVTIRFEKK